MPARIHYISPFANDLNIGREYNKAMQLIPDGDHACFTDHDVLFLLPTTKRLIQSYVDRYPHALLTCYTNRINPAAPHQLLNGTVSENTDILHHMTIAQEREKDDSASKIHKCISGFLMCFSKNIWKKYPFPETGKCLGVDSVWSSALLRNGVPIYRCNGVYVFHIYRLGKDLSDRSHLIPAA